MENAIHLSCVAYRYLIRLYPRDFRQEFSAAMRSVFEDELRDSLRQSGYSGIARVWREAILEVFTVAFPMQLRSALLVASAASLVGTTAIYLFLIWALTESSNIHRAAQHWRH